LSFKGILCGSGFFGGILVGILNLANLAGERVNGFLLLIQLPLQRFVLLLKRAQLIIPFRGNRNSAWNGNKNKHDPKNERGCFHMIHAATRAANVPWSGKACLTELKARNPEDFKKSAFHFA
jgi:hypothetical protein